MADSKVITLENGKRKVVSVDLSATTDHHAGFSFIEASSTITVDAVKQMRVFQDITIAGNLIVDGELIVD